MSRQLFDKFAWAGTSLYDAYHELLLPLLSSNPHTKLYFQPQALSILDVSLVITLFLIRSLLHAMRAFFVGTDKNAPPKVPEITLSMPLRLSKKDLDHYAHALGQNDAESIDLSNPQLLLFLSSVTEPAMLLLLAKRTCPILPLGAVNVRNRFELLRINDKSTPLLQTRNAIVTASLHGSPRLAKRGVEYDLEAVLSLPLSPESGDRVPVFRQVFTMLQFMNVDSPAIKTGEKKRDEGVMSAAMKVPFDMAAREPSAWATICKDYNPIHLSSVAARLYGFSGKIAHGNHVVAKALDAISSQSEDSASTLLDIRVPMWMEISFRRPMSVPARFEIHVAQARDGDDATEFRILQQDHVYVEGVLGKL